jgi:hypothetical protein
MIVFRSRFKRAKWTFDMNDGVRVFQQGDGVRGDEDILTFEVSDAALEAAARAVPGAAMSFPNAPTVSILVICCSFD